MRCRCVRARVHVYMFRCVCACLCGCLNMVTMLCRRGCMVILWVPFVCRNGGGCVLVHERHVAMVEGSR